MLRALAGVAAGGLLLWAGLPVGSGASVSDAGASATCAGPIVRAETRSDGVDAADGRVAAGLARACEQTDRQRLLWASLAGALSLGAAAVCASERRSRDADAPGRPIAQGAGAA